MLHRSVVITLAVLAAAWVTQAQFDPRPGNAAVGRPGQATCVLQLEGDGAFNPVFTIASLKCAGRRVVMAGHVNYVANFSRHFTGVSWDNRCARAGCLLTVCGDTDVVIANSSVRRLQLRDASLQVALCTQDRARILLHNISMWSNNVSAVVAAGESQLTVYNSSVAYNHGTHFAGGISAAGNASVDIVHSRISENRRRPAAGAEQPVNTSTHKSAACTGVGLSVLDNARMVLNASHVEDNTGTGCRGGGAAVDGSSLLLIAGASTIADNRASNSRPQNDGGGVYVGGEAMLVVEGRSRVVYNAADRGAGIFAEGNATVRITGGSLIANNAGEFDGAISCVDARGNARVYLSDDVRVTSSVNKGGVPVLASDAALVSLTGNVSVDYDDSGSTSRGVSMFVERKANLHIAPGATSNGMPLTRCSSTVNMVGAGSMPCGSGEVLLQMRDECQCCAAFSYNLKAGGDYDSCQQCPDNAKCPGGDQVVPLPGFWQSSLKSVQMHKCPLFTVACGQDGVCTEGYKGNLCGECDVGYGITLPLRCAKCATFIQQLTTYLLQFLGSVALVSYTVRATWQDNRAGDTALRPSDLIKILVQFLQYVVIFGSISVPWPDVLADMFVAAAMVFSVASGQSSLGCLLQSSRVTHPPQAVQRQLMMLLTAPVSVLIAVMLLICFSHWLQRLWVAVTAKASRGRAKPSLHLWGRLRVASLVVLFYAYPTMVKAALSFFACLRIDDPSKLPFPESEYAIRNHTAGYWVSAIQQECFVGWHKAWALGLALPATLILCIGVPGGLLLFLWRNRSYAADAAFREHYGFLYRNYTDSKMWWEAVWAVQTVLLTAISVFHFSMKAYYSLLLMGMIVLLSAAIQQVYRPYIHSSLHRLHIMATCCLFVNIWLGLTFFAVEFDQSSLTNVHTAAGAVMVFMNAAFVTLCVLRILEQAHASVLKVASAAVAWVKQKCGFSAGSGNTSSQSAGQQLPVQTNAAAAFGNAASKGTEETA